MAETQSTAAAPKDLECLCLRDLQLFPSGDFSGTSLSRVVRSVFKQDSVGEVVASLFLSMKYT